MVLVLIPLVIGIAATHAVSVLARRSGHALPLAFMAGLFVTFSAIGALSLMLTLSLVWGAAERSSARVSTVALEQVSRTTRMRFPAGAAILDGERVTGPRIYLVAAVDLPSDAVEPFLAMQARPFEWARVLRGEEAQSAVRASHLRDTLALMDRPGWGFGASKVFLYAEGHGHPTEMCLVMIEQVSPGRARVYIYWSQM